MPAVPVRSAPRIRWRTLCPWRAVVLPSASSASVRLRTSGPRPLISGIAARIVSDRAVGVRGERDAQRREHTDGGDADAVEPQRHVHRSHHILHVEADGAQIGEDNRGTDRQDGDGRRDHARPDPGDDDRGRPGLGASGDLLRRFIGVRSVIFGSLSDDDTGDEPRDDRARQPEPVLDSQQVEDTERRARQSAAN